MREQLDLPPHGPFRSVAELEQDHDELVGLCEWQDFRTPPAFPPPPYPGTAAIEPIVTYSELRRETREQHNCAVCYSARIAGGSHYFYRVRLPERATLSLVRVGNKWP